MSDVKRFFEMLDNDASAKALLAGEKPDNEAEFYGAYVNAATELGFTVSADDIKEELEAREAAVAAKTDETIGGMCELSAEEMDNVAGGAVIPHECKDTFKDEENCWISDGCDKYNNNYPDYRCKRHNKDNETGCDWLF